MLLCLPYIRLEMEDEMEWELIFTKFELNVLHWFNFNEMFLNFENFGLEF